jgi:hypothetical protein
MGEIYCLYSPADGLPRYVGQTEGSSRKRWEHHLALALKKREGALYDWIRAQFERQSDPEFHVLQENIIPADLDMFEAYWMAQFAGLLNVRTGPDPRPERHTAVGEAVISVIQGKLAVGADQR